VFRQRFVAQQQALIETVQRARADLHQLEFSDAIYAHASELCLAAQVDGLRADLVMLRAARALAALQGDSKITVAHLDAVAELALHHRRHAPFQHQHQPQSQTRTAPNDRGSAPQNSNSEPTDSWGEIPPQPVEAIAVKGVKPLPLKKC
jgi:magnesium chelatase subunit I